MTNWMNEKRRYPLPSPGERWRSCRNWQPQSREQNRPSQHHPPTGIKWRKRHYAFVLHVNAVAQRPDAQEEGQEMDKCDTSENDARSERLYLPKGGECDDVKGNRGKKIAVGIPRLLLQQFNAADEGVIYCDHTKEISVCTG